MAAKETTRQRVLRHRHERATMLFNDLDNAVEQLRLWYESNTSPEIDAAIREINFHTAKARNLTAALRDNVKNQRDNEA